jgi:hypothetical protein
MIIDILEQNRVTNSKNSLAINNAFELLTGTWV